MSDKSQASTYYVFGMKSKDKDYKIDLINVEGTTLVSLENAKTMKKKLLESGDYEKVEFYFSSQFKETKKNQLLDRIKYTLQPFEFVYPYLVADKDNGLWSHYETKEAALKSVEEKNKPDQDYKSDIEKQPFKIITWPEYNKAEKEKYVTAPVQISKQRYWELLECLPPKNWHTTSDSLNVFFMSEFQTGSYTEQLIKWGVGDETTYYSKGVDYCDKETWCKHSDLLNITSFEDVSCEAP